MWVQVVKEKMYGTMKMKNYAFKQTDTTKDGGHDILSTFHEKNKFNQTHTKTWTYTNFPFINAVFVFIS